MKNNILMSCLKSRDCTGCSICETICPTKAIKIELTKDGFYEPNINDELCIDCSLCMEVCYKFDNSILESNKNNYLSYSAINRDDKDLKSSTSGGVSIELMKECIIQGYKVVGVEYDYDKNIAVTKVTSEIKNLEKFKGSKYFQSYTVDAFEQMVEDKTDQKYAVFGTPCQIYSLYKYVELRKRRDKFLFVDLFCHGCPSMNLWIKYIQYSKEKFKTYNFDKIEFRSKNHGWHEYGFKFEKDKNTYNSKKINDPFYELFFDMNTLNKACYKCKVRSSIAYTDIRLGDFWGYQYDDNNKGVSAVVIASNRGDKIFNNIKEKFIIKQHSFNETVRAQSYGKEHYCNENIRRETLDLLNSNLNMEEIIKIYRSRYSINKKLKKASKNIMKCLPQGVYFKVKKIIHKC